MKRLLVTGAVAALACAGCGSTTETTTSRTVITTTTPAPPVDVDPWVGTWRTNFGQMELRADGSDVSGTYEYCGGELSGTVDDAGFNGTWEETPDAPDCDRGEGVPTSGTFSFVLSPDGKTFSGTWKYEDGSVDKQKPTWEGVRLQP